MIYLASSMLILSGCSQTTVDQASDTAPQESSSQAEVSETVEGLSLVDVDADDEEGWKKEPAYGETIQLITQSGCSAPINVAEEAGYYEEEGIQVELVQSSTTIMDAVGTGQVDIGVEHLTTAVVPVVNGINAQFIGPMHTGCKALYVAADSDIEDSSELEGKSIGIHDGLGLSDHNIALRFLHHNGVDPSSVQIVQTDSAASPQAIESGELDGAIYAENYAAPFVEAGQLKKINSITTDQPYVEEPCCVYVANRDFVKNNPITTKKLLRAMYKANAWAEDDTQLYVDFLYEHDLMSGDEDLGYEFIHSLNYRMNDQEMEEAMHHIISDYVDIGIIEEQINVKETIQAIWTPTGLEVEPYQG